MALQGYYNRFDAAKRYDELLFRASRGLQSAELNEIQAVLSDRMKRITDAIFNDGSVVRGASVAIDPQTGVTQLNAGSVYVLGAVREVAAKSFTIPTTGTVQIGVRVVTTTITEQEDASLRDPAVGTRNFQEAGAGRTRRLCSWSWSGDGEPGEFYSVYSVLNGALVTQQEQPGFDGVKELLAVYDRDSNGNYIVRGLNLTATGKDVTQSNYTFSVEDGVANVLGNRINKPTSTPISFPIDPDLQQVNNEPRSSASNGLQTITTSRRPLNNILDVIITAQKTVNMTHGSFSGALDPLPDSAVLSIESVTQGGTTYIQGTDYVLTADQVDWSLPGNEPAPGSSYTVTYRYITSVTPQNINPDQGTFQIEGAVQGTLVLTSYRWKLPRFDVLALDAEGFFQRVRGVASAFQPRVPTVPEQQLAIASYYLDWRSTSTPDVTNDGTRVLTMRDQRRIRDAVVELYDLVSEERLQRDVTSREPSAKFGVFVDPLVNNALRDAGVNQTAVINREALILPVAASIVPAAQNNSITQLLPFSEQVLIDQPLRTGEMKINPYANFDPVPANVVLDPAIDLWTITNETITEQTRLIQTGGPNWGWNFRTTTSVTTSLVGESRSPIEFLRQRNVNFKVEGFEPNEPLQKLLFDGVDVTPPSVSANSLGLVQGNFTVPPNIPAGTKEVAFLGQQGSYGAAPYTGQGTLVVRQWSRLTTITQFYHCPLAQSFVLPRGRHITGVDLQFAAVGNTSKRVGVQIREGSNGFPTTNVITQGVIPGSAINTSGNVRCTFNDPVFLEGNREYFIVLLTDDADHAVRIAQLGRRDPIRNEWVTAQPYTVGILLSSSNNSTWTPHQDMDLTFRLVGAEFTSNQRTINLGALTVSNMTDLLAQAPVELTSPATSVFFRYTRSNGETFEVAPGQALSFATAINDTLQVQAVLQGNSSESPLLFPGAQSIVGTQSPSGTYVGRQFQLGSGGLGTLRVVFDAVIQGSAKVVPQYDNNGFQELQLVSVTPIGNGMATYVYEDTGLVGLTATRVRLNLSGTAQHRPVVRNIRAVMV